MGVSMLVARSIQIKTSDCAAFDQYAEATGPGARRDNAKLRRLQANIITSLHRSEEDLAYLFIVAKFCRCNSYGRAHRASLRRVVRQSFPSRVVSGRCLNQLQDHAVNEFERVSQHQAFQLTIVIFVAIVLMITRRARITLALLIGVLLGLLGVALIVGADVRTGSTELLTQS